MKRCLLSLVALLITTGCQTVKPYEKEFLLNPLMDDAAVSALSPAMQAAPSGKFEKLAVGSAGSQGATSCPTCGG